MNRFDIFIQKLQENFPDLLYDIDKAEVESGSSWLDIRSGSDTLTIEFKPSYGFGIYTGDQTTFGGGPNEIYRDEELAIKRIGSILKHHKIEVRLDELQEMFGEPGVVVKKGDISKYQLDELLSFIESRGGSLEINAHFKECDLPISINSISSSR